MMKSPSQPAIYYIIALTIFLIAGCATIEYKPPSPYVMAPLKKGVYHRVKKGQTLWRIAKTYNVPLEEIVRINRLPDAAKIEVGELIFIPNAEGARDIVITSTQDAAGDFIWPVKGKVASFYGSRLGHVRNKGVDIIASYGQNVVASRSGTITFCAEEFTGYGKTIIIDHGDGFSSVYAYNSENLIRVGDVVEKGRVIAKAGSGGRAKINMLHFEIRKDNEPQNPFYYLP